jgi:FtsP/CotA-like multicopper oxidase with cupredoxin domain
MKPKSMSRVLQSCLLGVVTLGGGIDQAWAAPDVPLVPPLPDPPFWQSSGGVLNGTLTISPAQVTFNGQTFPTNLYNGLYIPPVWRVNPGDTMNITLVNQMNNTTASPAAALRARRRKRIAQGGPVPAVMAMQSYSNIHYHGFNVTPLAPADDVFLQVFPQNSGISPNTYNYSVPIPPSHPMGMFWFHPHPHGISEAQVLGGMSGAAIVDGILPKYYPEYAGVRERVMLLKDFQVSDDPRVSLLTTINGLPLSAITIAEGEIQFWRFANVAADAFFNLQMQDPAGNVLPFYVIAVDGNPTQEIVPANSLYLGAGARMEAFVIGPAAGTYVLKSLAIDTGPQGDPNPEVQLAVIGSVGVAKQPVTREKLLAAKPKGAADGRLPMAELIKGNGSYLARTFTFSETPDGNTFFINGREYDPIRVDTVVNFPAVEEWTIYNTSAELHVFHIHQLDYVVTEINGVKQNPTGYQDSVILPYQQGGIPGQVKIVVPFTDPVILGEFVYHCHILGHEDNGMMANIVVKMPGGAMPLRAGGAGRKNPELCATPAASPKTPSMALRK